MLGLNRYPVTSTYAVSDSNKKAASKFLFDRKQNDLRAHSLWVNKYVLPEVYLEKIYLSLDDGGKRYIEVLFSSDGKNMRLCMFPDLEKMRKSKKNVEKLSQYIYKHSEIECEADVSSKLVEELSMFVTNFIAKTAVD